MKIRRVFKDLKSRKVLKAVINDSSLLDTVLEAVKNLRHEVSEVTKIEPLVLYWSACANLKHFGKPKKVLRCLATILTIVFTNLVQEIRTSCRLKALHTKLTGLNREVRAHLYHVTGLLFSCSILKKEVNLRRK
ncbi:MAG: hypothetical protein QN229_07225 [Desulfurococcaceae archaeon TW002]